MKTPETIYHQLIDSFTQRDVCFALYRLPWTDEPILVMQEEGEPVSLDRLEELNQKKGFLLAPFQLTTSRPAVLIRPAIVAHDWEEIKLALQKWMARHPQPANSCVSSRQDRLPDAQGSSERDEKEIYTETFSRFILPLKEKQFRKLVLSRSTVQPLHETFSPLATFIQACNSYPRMMISLCHTPSTGTWIGSTPEIILSGHEKEWHTVALAGTMPMQGEVMPTEWSKKNKEEQAFVGEYIRKTVKKFGSKLTEKGPYTARAGQLVHLKTDFHFTLKDTDHLGCKNCIPLPPSADSRRKKPISSFCKQSRTTVSSIPASSDGLTRKAIPPSMSICAACTWKEIQPPFMPEAVSCPTPRPIPNGKKRSRK